METTIAQSVGVAIEPGTSAREAIMAHRKMDWEPTYRKVAIVHSIEGIDEETDCDTIVRIEGKVIPGARAVHNGNTDHYLGQVGPSFVGIPNRLAFSICDDIPGEIVGCGEYGGGSLAWMQMKLTAGSLPILGDDVIDQYVLIVTGHTGNRTLMYILTPVRVVCKNTLMAAIGGRKAESSGYIRHSGDVDGKVEFAKSLLTKAGVFFADTQEQFQRFAKTTLSQPTVEDYFKRVENVKLSHYVVDEETGKLTDELKGRKRNMFDRYMTAYHGNKLGADLPGVRGTAWGAYNAVTQVQDHDIVEEKRRATGGKSANDRAANQLFEAGPKVKQHAFDLALKLADSLN